MPDEVGTSHMAGGGSAAGEAWVEMAETEPEAEAAAAVAPRQHWMSTTANSTLTHDQLESRRRPRTRCHRRKMIVRRRRRHVAPATWQEVGFGFLKLLARGIRLGGSIGLIQHTSAITNEVGKS